MGHAGVGDQPAPADDDEVVGGHRHLAHQVAGDEHGAALGGERPQQGADPADALRVEPVDRLVEQQHLRVAEQRGGDAEPLAHAEREAAGPPAGDASRPTRSSTSSTRRRGMPLAAASASRCVRALRPGWTAWRPAARRPRAAAAQTPYGLPVDGHRAGGRRVQAEDHPHGRGLAGAVRAEEAGHPPGQPPRTTARRRPAWTVPLGQTRRPGSPASSPTPARSRAAPPGRRRGGGAGL